MSGNVIDLCPVGALTSKQYKFTVPTDIKHETHGHSGDHRCGCKDSAEFNGVHTRFQPWISSIDSTSTSAQASLSTN